MFRSARVLAALCAALALSQSASAYSYFVHYVTRNAPWGIAVEKFDLTALQNKTVPVLVANQEPAYAAGDSFAAMLSQIRLAAKVWNDVDGSDLRLAYGGTFAPGMQHSGPVIEVVFGEVPPGLIAVTTSTLRTEVQDNFVPILRSTVLLDRDQSQRPSWSEGFFLNLVHELGHAIGLQHGFTSSVMSTEIIRATTKAAPLALDDTAGVTALYPARPLRQSTASITGRVTAAGAGVNLASVVAVSLDGAAISALTDRDGNYRIDAVPPGSYFVYAHPLPPRVGGEAWSGGVLPGLDFGGQPVPATGFFDTLFYPNTKTFDRAAPVFLQPGQTAEAINFAVTRRTTLAVHGVQTFSFPGQVAVRPAHVSSNVNTVVASGYGLTARTSVGSLGSAVSVAGVKAYPADTRYVQMDFQLSLATGEGPRHLTFSSDNDTYVLPSAIRLVRNLPPGIALVAPGVDGAGNRIVNVSGTNIDASTQILFDGVVARTVRVDDARDVITVVPPPGPPGHKARVVAFNRDGQSSLFVQAAPTYDYDPGADWTFALTQPVIPSGAETLVEVTGSNAGFVAGQASLAFASATIQVRRTLVAGPNRLLADVWIAPNTLSGLVAATVTNGLRSLEIQGALTVGPNVPRALQLRGPVTEAGGVRSEIPSGGTASIRLVSSGAEPAASALQVSVDGRPAQVVSLLGGVLTFRVPAGLTPGPAVLRVASGSDSATISMIIDIPPPAVSGVNAGSTKVDGQRPAKPGETLTAIVTGAADAGSEIAPNRVAVITGGIPQTVVGITSNAQGHAVQFLLDGGTITGDQFLVIVVDGRASQPFTLPVKN